MGNAQELARFRALFEREIEHAGRLVEILEREYAALSDNDPAALERVVTEKRERIDKLETQGQLRACAMREAGFAPDPDGVERCVHDCDPNGHAGLAGTWEHLRELLARCRLQNEMNGQILETSRRYVQAALATLQRQPLPTELYGRNGCTTADGQSHTLAKV